MSTLTCVELLNRWRRQVDRRRMPGRLVRGIGAIGFLTDEEPINDLLPIKQLWAVVTCDEAFPSGHVAISVCGYRASRMADGVQWGGIANARFHKDLARSPRPGGAPGRLDLLNVQTMSLALRMNRRIDVALQYHPNAARRAFKLPRLWAAFSHSIAKTLVGAGPEFDNLCTQFGMEREAMFHKFYREFNGLSLYPLEWVSHRLCDAANVFVELTSVPRLQTFGVTEPSVDLVGYRGAAAFDFYNNRRRS